jgi:hypothetical protein
MAKTLPRIKMILFHVIMWAMVALPFLAGTILLSVSLIAYDVLQHPERHPGTYRIWNIIATNLYYKYEANIWQSQKGCVQYDDQLLYKPSRGCHFINKEFSTDLTFSEDGRLMTSARSNASAPPIFFAGDSETMGWGVNDDETFAALIASRVRMPVLNLAVSSYGTVREILRIRMHPRFGDANCIVIQYNSNDFDENKAFLAKGALPSATPERFQTLFSEPTRKVTFADVILQTFEFMLYYPLDFLSDVFGWGYFHHNPLEGTPRESVEDVKVFLAVLAAFPDLNDKKIFVAGPDTFISELVRENLPANVFPLTASLNYADS